MFRIEFRNRFDIPNPNHDRVYHSIEEAARARIISGDLVVSVSTGKIVIDDSWFFAWEKASEDCYVKKAVRWQKWIDAKVGVA